ncbi:hypothetical protein ACLB2K_018289 [Fragaria x ananassa]
MPTAFVDKLRGTPPFKCVLRDPGGQSWNVTLKERAGGLFFCNGWPKFVMHHCLDEGDFLVLYYTGKHKFDVKIYDESACEMDLEVSKRRRLTDGSIMSGKAVIEETPSGLTVFKSKYSCSMKTLVKCKLYEMTIPRRIVIAEGLEKGKPVKLQDPKKRSQIVNTTVTKDGRLKLTKGWSQSCREFEISIGDEIVFEFVKPNVILVHNLRGKVVILEGPKVVDSSNYKKF